MQIAENSKFINKYQERAEKSVRREKRMKTVYFSTFNEIKGVNVKT